MMNLADDQGSDGLRARIERDGFAITRGVVPTDLLSELRSLCSTAEIAPTVARRLSNEQLNRKTTSEVVACEVTAGDVMLMRPRLIHASCACERPGHRRVIQIEYATFDLPGGLEWNA